MEIFTILESMISKNKFWKTNKQACNEKLIFDNWCWVWARLVVDEVKSFTIPQMSKLGSVDTNCGTLMPQPKCPNTNCSSGSGSKINHTHTPTNCCSLPCLLVVVKISQKSRPLPISCSTTQWCQACLSFVSALSGVEIVRDLWTRSLFINSSQVLLDHTGKLGS